jgi:hypothetical protein
MRFRSCRSIVFKSVASTNFAIGARAPVYLGTFARGEMLGRGGPGQARLRTRLSGPEAPMMLTIEFAYL